MQFKREIENRKEKEMENIRPDEETHGGSEARGSPSALERRGGSERPHHEGNLSLVKHAEETT